MKLINAEQNKELLEKIPHRIFMDLAVVYYAVARDHEQEDIGTILLYNEHMEMWGQNEENLYQTAMINMRTDGEANLVSIENIIRRVLPNEDISLGLGGHRRDISMYILTNSRKRFGAAEILDKKTLRMRSVMDLLYYPVPYMKLLYCLQRMKKSMECSKEWCGRSMIHR